MNGQTTKLIDIVISLRDNITVYSIGNCIIRWMYCLVC